MVCALRAPRLQRETWHQPSPCVAAAFHGSGGECRVHIGHDRHPCAGIMAAAARHHLASAMLVSAARGMSPRPRACPREGFGRALTTPWRETGANCAHAPRPRRADGVGSRPERAWPHRGIRNRRKNRLPLRRAVQTAALVIAACGGAQRTESAHLLPSAAPDVIGTQLIRWGEDVDTLLVIAHLPLLPRLSHWLCGRLLAFEPADAWCLEAETEVAWQGTFDIVSVPE